MVAALQDPISRSLLGGRTIILSHRHRGGEAIRSYLGQSFGHCVYWWQSFDLQTSTLLIGEDLPFFQT